MKFNALKKFSGEAAANLTGGQRLAAKSAHYVFNVTFAVSLASAYNSVRPSANPTNGVAVENA